MPHVKCNRPLPCPFHGGLKGRSRHDVEPINQRHHEPRWQVDPRIFGIRVGLRWQQIVAKFLNIYE